MRGRVEHRTKMETFIKDKINDLPDYLNRYYQFLGDKSHTTKMVYINNVIRFLLHYGNGKYPTIQDLNNVDPFVIQSYVSEIGFYEVNDEVRELKETSKCTILSSLSSFFGFISIPQGAGKYIEDNPFNSKLLKRPKPQENQVVFLTPEEVKIVEKQILDGVGNQTSVSKQKNWKYRDLLLFRLPVINGLRVTALSEINIEDIDFINKKIRVTEKRNITKDVDFDYQTMIYLQLWIEQRRKLLGDVKTNVLFISNRRTRMTTRSIENVISKYTECIPGKHITPHKLRSTCGTNLYQAKKDIYLVSKVLGHKNTAPTKRYAAVFDKDITNAVNDIANLYS